MLKNLYVRNFALIDELSASFAPGLSIITGETGAGKSILIGALNLVLGERASTELVRTGATKAVIEAVFSEDHYGTVASALENAGIDITPDLILRREISSNGQSRCFINDCPCPVALLKQTGQQLVDLHGQHEHQLLLHADTHISLLDDFGGLADDTSRYREHLLRFRELSSRKEALLKKSSSLREKRGLLEYQFKELNETDLREQEAEQLDEEINLLENAETLFSLSSELGQILYDSDQSAYTVMSSSMHLLEKLAGIDRRFEIHLEELRGATTVIEEINRFLTRYVSSFEFNREHLDELRERQMLLHRLGKKYGKTIPELIEFRNELAGELVLDDNLADEIAVLDERIDIARKELSAEAYELSGKRSVAASAIEKAITENLRQLGIPFSAFQACISHDEQPEGDILIDGKRYRTFGDGYDRVEFMISTNIGEQPKPLAKVASGGEISRIMLALKSALARSARLPILVFDEIDTGISGSIAQTVGFSLKSLSRLHQIIAITHLPQIAAMADLHLAVSKSVQADRTVTAVRDLDKQEHIREVARLISGKNISSSSINLAEELIEAADSV
jgi:DNA repair protein RecN (Recombination protein N)